MINTLTLNPAIDKILYVDRFVKNVTTRIIEQKETLGGKGTHVSLNLSFMGKAPGLLESVLAAQGIRSLA